MKTTAKLNNLRISPRKVRLVADLIRGLDVSDAKSQLTFTVKRSSKPLLKLLNSAIANAKHNNNLSENSLYISEIFVNEGPTLKRIRPRAMGRAFYIRKRMSHVTLVLDEREFKKGGIDEKREEKKKEVKKSTVVNDKKSSDKVVDNKMKKSEKLDKEKIKNSKKDKN